MKVLAHLAVGLRGLRRQPIHSTIAVVVLALGLAASATAFSFINTFYQRVPGAHAGDRLVSVRFVDENGRESSGVSYPDYLDYASQAQALDGLAGVVILIAGPLQTVEESATDWVWGRAVTANFFSVLGVDVSPGRSFSANADRPESAPEVVLSHRLWLERFAGDPSVVGRTVLLRRQPFTVVGVASPEFRTIFEGFHPDLWISLGGLTALSPGYGDRFAQRDRDAFGLLGRLPSGVTPDEAATRLSAVAEQLRAEYHAHQPPSRVVVQPKLRILDRFTTEMQPVHLAMIVTAGILLLLAIANTSNVLLAISLGRRREFAVRSALGASPWELVRLMLSESLGLTLAAGGLGLLLTVPASKWLMWSQFLAGTSLLTYPAAPVVKLDLRFYVFTLVLALLAGGASSLLPALRTARRPPGAMLKQNEAGAPEGRPGGWLGRVGLSAHEVMVVVQVGFAVVLLVAAGLMVRSFGRAIDQDVNFESDNLLVGSLSLAAKDLDEEGRKLYLRRLEERLEAEPGFQSAVVTRRVPFGMGFSGRLRVEGEEESVALEMGAAEPGYFETLGLPLIAGRSLDERDDAEALGAVVVNESMARRFFPDREVLGRRVVLEGSSDRPDRSFEIVGIVSDVRYGEGKLDWWREPTVYFSLDQYGYTSSAGGFSPGFGLLVRTSSAGEPSLLERRLHAHDSELTVTHVVSMSDLLDGQLYEQRANVHYFSALAGLGLVLATIGLWSVLQVAVSRRMHEIGIRKALGARGMDITAAVVSRGLRSVAVGLVGGLGLALLSSRLLSSLLYGITAVDPWSFLAGALILLTVTGIACYLPGRRAARADPLECLRED